MQRRTDVRLSMEYFVRQMGTTARAWMLPLLWGSASRRLKSLSNARSNGTRVCPVSYNRSGTLTRPDPRFGDRAAFVIQVDRPDVFSSSPACICLPPETKRAFWTHPSMNPSPVHSRRWFIHNLHFSPLLVSRVWSVCIDERATATAGAFDKNIHNWTDPFVCLPFGSPGSDVAWIQ